MSRAALLKTALIMGAILALTGIGSWAYVANSPGHKVSVVTNAQHKVTQLSYQGQKGQDALALLKKHAIIKTKHYSFGDQVIAINGTEGNGPKYWTFYVNGKISMVGAGDYATKDSDMLMWKLQ